MKTFRLLRFFAPLFATVFGAVVFAQTSPHSKSASPHNEDEAIVSPDGTIPLVLPPTINDDGSLTLPDETTIIPPASPMRNKDGSISLPDGTMIDANGTITRPDGTVIDSSKRPDSDSRGDRAPDQRPAGEK